jgi:hypothetical protein
METPVPAGRSTCDASRALLGARAGGTLADDSERALLAHLAVCGACRAAAAAVDPAVLFLELRSGPLPEPFWAGFDRALAARLESRPAGFDWRSLFRYPRMAYLTTPLAMLLVLGVTMFVARPGGPLSRPGEGIPSPFRTPAGAARPAPGRRAPTGASGTPAAAAPGSPAGSAATAQGDLPPALEEVGSPKARVYRFSVGAAGDETPVYLVVDESIDI